VRLGEEGAADQAFLSTRHTWTMTPSCSRVGLRSSCSWLRMAPSSCRRLGSMATCVSGVSQKMFAVHCCGVSFKVTCLQVRFEIQFFHMGWSRGWGASF
jgi:hypothetical protein